MLQFLQILFNRHKKIFAAVRNIILALKMSKCIGGLYSSTAPNWISRGHFAGKGNGKDTDNCAELSILHKYRFTTNSCVKQTLLEVHLLK